MSYRLTDEGKKYLKTGLPEINLIKSVETGNISIKDASSMENFAIALQWAKKNDWIEIKNGMMIQKKSHGTYETETALKKMASGDVVEKNKIKKKNKKKKI